MDNSYHWVPFYEALADKLLQYNDKREELFSLMKKAASEQPLMKYLHFEKEDWWQPRNYQIDPFSVIGVMNRGTTDANRIVLAKVLASIFDIKISVPTEFRGIPILDNRKSLFAGVDEVWDLFVHAMKSSEVDEFSSEFKIAFEKSISITGNGLAYITTGLFWIRPNVFMPLDKNSRSHVLSEYGIAAPGKDSSGDDYVRFLSELKSKLKKTSPELSLKEVSHNAWVGRGTEFEGFTNEEAQHGAQAVGY